MKLCLCFINIYVHRIFIDIFFFLPRGNSFVGKNRDWQLWFPYRGNDSNSCTIRDFAAVVSIFFQYNLYDILLPTRLLEMQIQVYLKWIVRLSLSQEMKYFSALVYSLLWICFSFTGSDCAIYNSSLNSLTITIISVTAVIM